MSFLDLGSNDRPNFPASDNLRNALLFLVDVLASHVCPSVSVSFCHCLSVCLSVCLCLSLSIALLDSPSCLHAVLHPSSADDSGLFLVFFTQPLLLLQVWVGQPASGGSSVTVMSVCVCVCLFVCLGYRIWVLDFGEEMVLYMCM